MSAIGRVLIVDDEALLAETLRRVLADEFDVSVTIDAAEALRRLTGGDWYDVILCDVMMPTMNGVELRDRVHAARPELAARIVFITGGITCARIRSLLERVPNTVMAKPFDFAALRELIRRRTVTEPLPRRGAR